MFEKVKLEEEGEEICLQGPQIVNRSATNNYQCLMNYYI